MILQQLLATAVQINTGKTPPNSSPRDIREKTVSTYYNSPAATLHYMDPSVLELLYYAAVNNCRISELLSINQGDCVGNDRYVVRGQKGSRSYTVHLPGLSPVLDPWSSTVPQARVFPVRYKVVWRWCVRCGIGFTPPGHRNVARTHAHRYQTAAAVNCKADKIVAGDVLHHRSQRSISYYIKKQEVACG